MRTQRLGRRWAAGALALVVAAGLVAVVPATRGEAAPVAPRSGKSADAALGNGLGRLVAEQSTSSRRVPGGVRLDNEALTIRDAEGRVLVHLTPRAGVDRRVFRREAADRGLVVQAVDTERGTLEGFAAVDAVAGLAALPGTGTLAQALRPRASGGAVTSRGVALQRASRAQAAGAFGQGVTIGALSDSYDTATTTVGGSPLTIHAAQDVASGDLPGPGNAAYPAPVRVLEDFDDPVASDEGRAMLQIVHDVAPAAELCFATAFTGLVGFAENVRRLADPNGPCDADVLVDDVTYFDEPMFSDSVLSDAIDDVTAAGTHYVSAAGNGGEQGAWQSAVKLVPTATGLRGTNLDFGDVDPALYDGGLQDLQNGPGIDVAQEVTIGPGREGLVNVQWDDPVDLDGATLGAPLFAATGAVTTTERNPTYAFTATAGQVGQTVQIRTDGIPSGSTDLVLTVRGPDGRLQAEVDTGASPEVFSTRLTQAGTYSLTVSGFDGATGDFTLDVRRVLAPSTVTTDFNVLVFDEDGAFIGAAADRNPLSGRPSEIASLVEEGRVQLVIARAGTGPVGATRLRNVLNGDASFTEYADPEAPAVFGHATARGATAVAAYDPFRPYLPEAFSSPGGDLPVVFDSAGRRYATPSVRRVPQVAGADGVNTTFFATDSLADADSLPNFFGTSAAAPHVAGIAALVLGEQAGGTPLTPAAMRVRLQRSTFAHDLDPDHAEGTAGGLTVTADGAQGSEQSVPGSMADPDFFRVSYTGRVPLRSVTFYGETASPTALGRSGSTASAGIVFDPRSLGRVAPYTNNGSPFAVGGVTGGLRSSSVQAVFGTRGGSYAGQYRHLRVSFTRGLARGQSLQFGVDRDLAVSRSGSTRGNGADELGGANYLPTDSLRRGGLRFVATRTDGTKITGSLGNRLGRGYSVRDGYGLVDAERAVLAAGS